MNFAWGPVEAIKTGEPQATKNRDTARGSRRFVGSRCSAPGSPVS